MSSEAPDHISGLVKFRVVLVMHLFFGRVFFFASGHSFDKKKSPVARI
jgi:hypothetical protein